MFNLANGRVILKFNNSALVQKRFSSLYSNFVSNLYIVYEFNNWPSNPSKTCLFDTVKLTTNVDESKFNYNVWGIVFDGECSWSFGNGFARNVVIFGVGNSWSSHTDNKKMTF